jgi:hypothetical protein
MDRRSQAQSGVVVQFPSGRPLPQQELGNGPGQGPRGSRRLADKILVSFHLACDQGELEIADALLRTCELAVAHGHGRADPRADDDRLSAAFERIWFLHFSEEGKTPAPPARAGLPEG